jgi:hypothetical protein
MLKKNSLFIVLLMLMLLPIPALAGNTAISSSDSGAIAGASAYVGPQQQGQGQGQQQGLLNSPTTNQSIRIDSTTNIPPGQGRFLLGIPNIPGAPLINYFGPWKEPANILETSLGMPLKVTRAQAKNAYKGGVTSRINILNPVTYTVDNCELLSSIPAGAVTRGFTFLKGDGDATSVDLQMKAYTDAMNAGASKVVILKKQASTKNTAFGATIGIGGGVSSLQGSEKENGLVVGGGTGLSWGSSEPQYKDGMAVLMIE